MSEWQLLFCFLRAWFLARAAPAAEHLAYRQRLATGKYQNKRPRLRALDRVFWIWLSRLWFDWCTAFAIVQPATVVAWHRQGFRLYWRWKSCGGKQGRPRVDRQVQALSRRISRENPLWGAPRIQSELRLLGYDLAESTVVQRWIKNLGIEEVVSAPRSPWQNPYAERLVGSIRRELLHYVIVLNETRLNRLLSEHFVYYHEARTHLSLDRNAPMPREVEPPDRGHVIAIPHVGGLHHRYSRRAA